MNEQTSLSFSILPTGESTACVSVMPFVEGSLIPEQQVSAIIGNHNIKQEAESKFIAALTEAVIEFRASKGI